MAFSGKRTRYIVHRGYKYREQRVLTNGNISWRCAAGRCAMTVHTDPAIKGFVGTYDRVDDHKHGAAGDKDDDRIQVIDTVVNRRRRRPKVPIKVGEDSTSTVVATSATVGTAATATSITADSATTDATVSAIPNVMTSATPTAIDLTTKSSSASSTSDTAASVTSITADSATTDATVSATPNVVTSETPTAIDLTTKSSSASSTSDTVASATSITPDSATTDATVSTTPNAVTSATPTAIDLTTKSSSASATSANTAASAPAKSAKTPNTTIISATFTAVDLSVKSASVSAATTANTAASATLTAVDLSTKSAPASAAAGATVLATAPAAVAGWATASASAIALAYAAATATSGPRTRPRPPDDDHHDDDDDDDGEGTGTYAPPMECHADAASRIVVITTPEYLGHLGAARTVEADGCAWRAGQRTADDDDHHHDDGDGDGDGDDDDDDDDDDKCRRRLYAVHVRLGRVYVQPAFFLLPDRSADAYETAWRLLRPLCPGGRLEPRAAVLDADADARRGFARAFPGARVTVGRHHLARAWHRRLARLGLTDAYRDAVAEAAAAPHRPPPPPPCRTVGEWVARFFGLAMLPADRVCDAFRELVDAAPPATCRKTVAAALFADHLRATYVRAHAPCPPRLWAREPGAAAAADDDGDGPAAYWRRVDELFGGPGRAPLDAVAVALLEHQADTRTALATAARYGRWKKKLASHGAVVSRHNERAWRALCENRLSVVDYLHAVACSQRV